MSGSRAADFRAVALDVDGTITRSDHQVSDYSLAVLNALEQAGIPVVLVTGRTRSSTLSLARRAGLSAPVVCCNGAILTDPRSGKNLQETTIPGDMARRTLEFLDRHCLVKVVWTPERMYASRRTESLAHMEAMNDDEEILITNLDELGVDNLVKVMSIGPKEELDQVSDAVAREIPFFHRSLDLTYETSMPDASKWHGLEKALELIGVPPAACIGAGDGETDIEWLEGIGYAVAPQNALESVKAIAAEVIGHTDDDATAGFLAGFFGLEVAGRKV